MYRDIQKRYNPNGNDIWTKSGDNREDFESGIIDGKNGEARFRVSHILSQKMEENGEAVRMPGSDSPPGDYISTVTTRYNFHTLSVTWSKPPQHVKRGEENKVAFDMKAMYDGKGFSLEQLRDDAKGSAESYVTEVIAVIMPEATVKGKVYGFTWMRDILSQSRSLEDFNNFNERAVSEVGEEAMEKAYKGKQQAIWKDKISDVAEGRLACSEQLTQNPDLGNEAYMLIQVTTELRSKFLSGNRTSSVTQIYLYRLAAVSGGWKLVGKSFQQGDDYSVFTRADKHSEIVVRNSRKSYGCGIHRTEYKVDNWAKSTLHEGSCAGEFFEGSITYTPPEKFYRPGDRVTTTIKTKDTKYSENFCSDLLPRLEVSITTPDRKKILVYLTNSTGNSNFGVIKKLVRTEVPTLFGTKVKHVVNIEDITENPDAAMVKHEAGDTVLLCYTFSYSLKGEGKKVLTEYYTYVWDEGDDASDAEGSGVSGSDESDSDTPGVWILIPVGIGVFGGGIFIKKWVRMPKWTKQTPDLIDANDRGVKYQQTIYGTDNTDTIRHIQRINQWSEEKNARTNLEKDTELGYAETTAKVVDKVGDGAIIILDKNSVTKPVAVIFTHGKTFCKGVAEDYANGKNMTEAVSMNTLHAVVDSGKYLFPSGELSKPAEIAYNTYIDSLNSTIRFTYEGKSNGKELLTDVGVSAIKNTISTYGIAPECVNKQIIHSEFEDAAMQVGTDTLIDTVADYIKGT